MQRVAAFFEVRKTAHIAKKFAPIKIIVHKPQAVLTKLKINMYPTLK